MDQMATAPVVPKLLSGTLLLEGRDTDIIHNMEFFGQPAGSPFAQPMAIMEPTYQLLSQEQLIAQPSLASEESLQRQFDPLEFTEIYPRLQVPLPEGMGWNEMLARRAALQEVEGNAGEQGQSAQPVIIFQPIQPLSQVPVVT
jgi:hypothetical protein